MHPRLLFILAPQFPAGSTNGVPIEAFRRPMNPPEVAEVEELGIVMWDGTPKVRLRSSPSTGANNVIESLAFNTHVQVVKRIAGGWLQTSTRDGRSGYVAATYIWLAPEHPLPEPNARLHRVAKGRQGTAIGIAEREYPHVKWGQDLRFYVNVLAVANRISIPNTLNGWKSVAFQADQLIWVPSQKFAQTLHGMLRNGSYSHAVAATLGIEKAFEWVGQLQADLRKAIRLSLQYIPRAVAKHVEQSLVSALTSLLVMATGAVLLLAISTAAGAAVGAIAGGAGAAPGAAVGFEVGVALLEWLGLAFLIKWVADSALRIGAAFKTFFSTVWSANGNARQLDRAAQELAEAIGVVAGVAVEALLMWAAAKGVTTALTELKGTQFAKAFGESRLGSWLQERAGSYRQGIAPVPRPRDAIARLRARRKAPPTELVNLAQQARTRYARELEPARRQIGEVFRGVGEVQARAKDPVSAANRLQRAIERFGAKVTSVEGVLANLWDAIGTRLVLSDTSPAGVNKVVGCLVEGIRSGKLQVKELNNLHGPEGKPYFSQTQIQAVRNAAARAGQPLRVNESKLMDSGYTVVCVYLRHGNGVLGELQILGPRVLKIANVEHIPYDVSLHKPLVRGVPPEAEAALRELVTPVESVMSRMTDAQHRQYQAYLNRAYIHARNTELGIPSEAPRLPPELNEVMSIESIEQLMQAIKVIQVKYKGRWPWAVQSGLDDEPSRGAP